MEVVVLTCLCLTGTVVSLIAEPLSVQISQPATPNVEGFSMGTAKSPDGTAITVDSASLLLDGERWTPAMGELHYARYPAKEWREELLKMKAGGIDIVATYVFWIHHEEVEGVWDWSDRRSLRQFVETAGDVGLKVIVRCGPWCHGEVRNGGLPDWILQKGWRTRSNDANYLAQVEILYGQIAKQLEGLLWKDGGPVIGIQLENEYRGPAEHLLTLKQIALEAGLDVPLYTRTGWPALRTPMPFGEIIPLYGVYAEGFWDRELTPMPGRYWAGFHFSTLRTDANIANEILGRRDVSDAADVAQYPYLTCEIGGGMMSSYHRRILVDPADIESITLVKLGSGSTSPGYYMYHGGVNPDGKLSTLMESQANGEWNDLPVKNYDFQTALGQYGQLRPQYHSLRRLHLFLDEWGRLLAHMPVTLPDNRPTGKDDSTTLRWSVRSDGHSGFVFVNNYQRLEKLPPKENVQFVVHLTNEVVTFPGTPITVPSGSRFIWPFNMELGQGVELAWATVQPVTAIDDGHERTIFFAKTPGVASHFAFKGLHSIRPSSGELIVQENQTIIRNPSTGRSSAIEINDGNELLRIVLLDSAASLKLWKGVWSDRERVFLTSAGMILDGQNLRLKSADRSDLTVSVLPPPNQAVAHRQILKGRADGVFTRFAPLVPTPIAWDVDAELIQPAGSPRKITVGNISLPVAAAPEDQGFKQAAVWRINLPEDIDLDFDPILRLRYVGDVARVMIDGKLIMDDFYNGNPLEIGLRRYASAIQDGTLTVAILPLCKDAPIYLADEAKRDFGNRESVAELSDVEIIPQYFVDLEAR